MSYVPYFSSRLVCLADSLLLSQTKGFRELIDVGSQTRPSLFKLAIKKLDVLYSKVIEINERAVVQWPELIPADGAMVTPEGDKLVMGLSGEVVRIVENLDVARVT